MGAREIHAAGRKMAEILPGRPKSHTAGREMAENLPVRPKTHAAGTLRPAPDTGRTNGYGKGPFLRGGP